MFGIIVLLAFIFTIIAITLWVFCYRSIKGRKNTKAIIFAIIGLLIFIPPVYLGFNIYNLLKVDNFYKEFIEINQGFNHIHNSHKKSVTGIKIEIDGLINGQGKLIILRPPYEENMGLILELDKEINIKMESVDWYDPEFLLKFIPENDSVEGKILVKIQLY